MEIPVPNQVLRLCVCVLLGLPVPLLARGPGEQLQSQRRSCLELKLLCFSPLVTDKGGRARLSCPLPIPCPSRCWENRPLTGMSSTTLSERSAEPAVSSGWRSDLPRRPPTRVLNLGSPPPSQGVLSPPESQALAALARSSQELVDLKSVDTSGHSVARAPVPEADSELLVVRQNKYLPRYCLLSLGLAL